MSSQQRGSEAKPPNFPKPIRTAENIEREKMLKNRLKLKWGESRTPFRDTITHPGAPTKVDDMTVKGFGEQQFADSVHEELPLAPGFEFSNSLFDNSSTWAEGNGSPGRVTGVSKVQHMNSQHHDRLLDSASLTIQARTAKGVQKDITSKIQRTHRDVSQSFIDEGYPRMVKSLVGEADFCYVESVDDDFYRFGVKSTIPSHIISNQYSTISARGLLRNVGDGSEMVPLPVVAHEAVLYAKLGQLKIFRTYRTWKTFYVWKHTVRRNRFERRRELLNNQIIITDKLCRELIFECRKMLSEIQKFPLFYRDDTKLIPFAEYIEEQRARNRQFLELKQSMFERIVELLCSRCEHYLFDAAANAPNAVTVAKYQSMKLNALATAGALQEASNSAQKVIHLGLSQPSITQVLNDNHAVGATVSHQTNLPEKPSSFSPRAKIASDKLATSNTSNTPGNALEAASLDGGSALYTAPQASQYAPGKNFDVGISYTIRSAIRLTCRRLMSLFRLVDYMIRDVLYDTLQTCSLALLQRMELISTTNHIMPNFGCSRQSVVALDELAAELAKHPKGAAVAWAAKREEDKEAALALNMAGTSLINSSGERDFVPVTPMFTVGTELHRRPIRNKRLQLSIANKDSVGSDEIKGGAEDDEEDIAIFESNYGKVGAFDCISYQPSIEKAIDEFQQILREVCLICMYPEGLFFHERCILMFEPVKNELSSVTLEDRIFLDHSINNPVQITLRGCVRIFVDDFRYLIEQFESLSILCVKGNLCETACQKAIVSRLHGMSADEITGQLNVWDDQSVLFGGLVSFLVLGIFRIDLTIVKRTIIDVVNKAQSLYIRIIPDLYVHYGDEFFRDVSKYTDNLALKVNTLEDFIKCVEAYNIAVTKINDVNDRFFYISSLRNIIEVREIGLSEGILRQNLTLSSAYQRFSNSVAEFENQVEMQVKVYGAEIATRLKAIMVPIQEFTDYVLSINHALINETKEPDAAAIVTQLTKCRKDIDHVGMKLKQLDYYQGLLNLSIFERGLEREIEDILHAQFLLWKSWMTFHELSGNFMAVHFLDANCDGILKDVVLMRNELQSTRYFHHARELITNSDASTMSSEASNVKGIYSAYEMLLKDMLQMIRITPLIKELQSPTLKPMHVERIQTAVGQKFFDEAELTVGELVDVFNIAQFSAVIHQTYKESRVLFHLETTVHNIAKAFASLKFEFAVEQENKSLTFVSNFPIILENIEDYTHSLFACRHSPYSAVIKAEIDDKLQELKTSINSIRAFQQFQVLYLKLRSLFTSPRTARQISPFMRNFKAADENWRLLIKNARDLEYVENFLSERVIHSSLKHATENIRAIQDGFRDLRREQCEKYPKLYLMEDSALEALYIQADIKSVFLECCKVVFPFLVEDVIFDYQEPYNVNTIICTGEKIVFQKSCSARTNLSDWLKACEQAVKERFEKDLRSLTQEENRPIIDEIRAGRFTGQALMLKMEMKFWSTIDRIMMDHVVEDKHEILAKLKAYIVELGDQVTMIGSILSDPVNSRTIMLVSNCILTYCHFKDIAQFIYDDLSLYLSLGSDHEGPLKSPFSFSALQYPLKKTLDASINAIMVEQGCFRERYGMIYQGFRAKLVITPLAERSIYALTTAFHSLSSRNHYNVPVLSGQSNSTTMQMLAYEMGMEYFTFDVACLPAAGNNFYEKLSNVLKMLYTSSTIWVSLKSSEPLSATHTSILGNIISIFAKKMSEFQQINYTQQQLLAAQTPGSAASNPSATNMRPASNSNEITGSHNSHGRGGGGDTNSFSPSSLLPAIASGKLFLINASRLLPTIKTAQSTFSFLRPFHTPYVPIREILHVLLMSYNFVFIQKLVTQLEAFQVYMVNHGWVQENTFRRLLIRAVHALGVENEHQMMNASTQMSLIVKKCLSELLRVHRKIMSEQDLRIVYNLYFEAIYNPETDCPNSIIMELEQKALQDQKDDSAANEPETPHDDLSAEEASIVAQAQRLPQRLLSEMIQQQNFRLQVIQTQGAASVFPGDQNIVDSIDNVRHAFYCVVGEPSVGKSTMIGSVLSKLEGILAATPQKVLEMLPDYIKVHPHRLNPALLNNLPGAVIFGDISDSDGILRAMGEPMKLSSSNRDWHFFHVDVWSSSQYLDYLVPAQKYLHQRFPMLAASVFCEMTDLQDLTPSALSAMKIVWMPNMDKNYTFDDVLEQSIKKYASSGGQALRMQVKICAEMYLRPCLNDYPGIDSYPQTKFVLIDRILHLAVLLLQYYAFPAQNALSGAFNSGGSSGLHGGEEFTATGARKGIAPKFLGRFEEENLRKIFVFSCIWVIGVSAYNHRETFETWFREAFAADHTKEYVEKKRPSVYPFFAFGSKPVPGVEQEGKHLQSRSIFDYVLHRNEGKQWTLEWVHAGRFFFPEPRDDQERISPFAASRDSLLFTDQLISSNKATCIVPTLNYVSLSLVHAAMMHTTGFLEQRASGLLLYSHQHGTGRSSLMQNLACQVSQPENPFAYFPTCPRWIYYGRDDKSASHIQKALTAAQIRFEHQRIERGLSNFGVVFVDDVALLSDHHQHNHDGASAGLVAVSRAGEVLRSLLEQREYFDPTVNKFRQLWYPAVVASLQINQHISRSEGDRAWNQQYHRFSQHFFLYEVTPMQVRDVLANYMRIHVGWGIEYDILGDISKFTHLYFEQLHRVVNVETEQSSWLSEKSYSASERLFLITLRDINPSVWSAWVIKQAAVCIHCLDSVAPLDIIKVWDRIVSDLSVRHIQYPKIQEIFTRTMEFCLNGPSSAEISPSGNATSTPHTNSLYGDLIDMSSSPIVGMLEKERANRMSSLEMLQQSAIAPDIDDAISYTRNCVGFFRTGPHIFPSILTMEYIRDSVWKHFQEDKRNAQLEEDYPFYAMLLRTQRTTAGFWTDILRFVTVIATNRISAAHTAAPVVTSPILGSQNSIPEIHIESAFSNPRVITLVPTTNLHVIHPRVFFAAQYFHNMTVETLSIGCAKVHSVSSMLVSSTVDISNEGSTNSHSAGGTTMDSSATNDIEMRLLRAILLDEEMLRRLKEHLANFSCQSLVDPLIRNALASRYGAGLVSLIIEAEKIFSEIDITEIAPKPVNGIASSLESGHSVGSGLKAQKETVWIIEDDDDFTGDSHDPRLIATYFNEVLQMMSLETPQLFEFFSLLNPLLDPRLYDNVRRALIHFQQRQHIVISIRSLYADQLGHLLRTTKRLVKVVHLHPESDEAEKLAKLMEVLPEKLEVGMERSKFMNCLHGFIDWYQKERQSSLNRMVFDIQSFSIFDVVQRLLQKEDQVKSVDLKLKLLHYLIRLAGYTEQKTRLGDTEALFLPQMITWEGPISISTGGPGSGLGRKSLSFSSRRRSSTGALMVGPAYGASFVLACDMMFLSSALHCDSWVAHHAHHNHHKQHNHKLHSKKDLQHLSVEATIQEHRTLENSQSSGAHHSSASQMVHPIPLFLHDMLGPLLHESFLNDIRSMQSLPLVIAMANCLSEVPFTTPKWYLVHSIFRLFMTLPSRSTCKGMLSTLAYGIASESTLIINDYTFLAAPFLDHVLNHDLHLGTSAANMSDVNLNVHCLSWKIHPISHYHAQKQTAGSNGQPAHKRKHDIDDLAPSTINITRADISIATDLMMIHLLSHSMFAILHKELQEAWDRKCETVRQVVDTLNYLTSNLQEYEQLPGMKFQNMLKPDEEEVFDRLWHDARHRLIRAMEANIILSTNVFKFIHTYDKTRQFMAWFSSFLVLLEDSIFLQDHDTNGEELRHNIGLASMKALSVLTPHMITHEGDRLWLSFSIFLDYFFVIDSNRSEYVFGEQSRLQFLQCLNNLTITEAINKNIGLDAFLGIVRKEKIIYNTGKTSTKLARHNSGIHSISEEDSVNDDESVGDHSSRADSDSRTDHGAHRSLLGDLVLNASNFKEYTVISAHSRAVLKQTLQTISHIFTSGVTSRSFYSTYSMQDEDSSTSGHTGNSHISSVPVNNLSILAAIDTSIDEWIEWASDTTTDLQDIPWYASGDDHPPLNPLEELLLVLVFKPALLPQVLFDKICVIGYDVDPVTVRALLLSEESLKRGFHHTSRMTGPTKNPAKTASNHHETQGKSGDELVLYYAEDEDMDIGCVLHSGGSAQRQGFPIVLATADEEEVTQNRDVDNSKQRRSMIEQKLQAMMNKRTNRQRSYSEQSYHQSQDDARLIFHGFLTVPSSHSVSAFQTSLEALITFLKQELMGSELVIPASLLLGSMTSDRNHGSMMQHVRRQRSASNEYTPGSGPGTAMSSSFVSPRRSLVNDGTNKNQQPHALAIASMISFDMTHRPCTLAIRLLFENQEQVAFSSSMNNALFDYDDAAAYLAAAGPGIDDAGVSSMVNNLSQKDPWAIWSSSVSASVLPIDDENEDDVLHCDAYRHWKVFPLARIKSLIEEQYPNMHVVFYADDGSDHVFELNEIPEVGLSVVTQPNDASNVPFLQGGFANAREEDSKLSLRFDDTQKGSEEVLLPQSDTIHKYHWGYPYYTPLMPTHSEYSDELILWRLRNNLRVLFDMGPSWDRPWLAHHLSWTYQLINHAPFQHNPLHMQQLYSSLRQPINMTQAKREVVTSIMNRLRWLLVLFHTALPFSAPKDSVEYSDSGDTAAINSEATGHVDQIMQYFDYRDEALCKAVELAEELVFHHVMLSLEPAYQLTHPHHAQSNYASVSRVESADSSNGRSEDGVTLDGLHLDHPHSANSHNRPGSSSTAASNVTVTITDQFLLVLQEAILNGAYQGNDLGIHDYGQELRMKSVFQSIFAPHCLDLQVAYMVLNAIPLPVGFDPTVAQTFVNQLNDYVEAHPDCGCFEDLGYLNISLCHHRNIVRWQSGMKRFLVRQTFLPPKDLHHHPSCSANSGLLLSENTVFRFSRHMNDDIRDGLKRFLDLLPEEIHYDSKEFQRQMQAHSLRTDQQLTTFKGRQTRVGAGPQLSTLAASQQSEAANKQRRAGQRMLLRFQAHEYDVMWAFLMSEIAALNRRIRHWREYLRYLLTLDTQGWKDHVLHHLPGRKCDDDWQDMFLQLQAGVVPNIWCSASLLAYLFEAGYNGSRCSQHLHHTLGHHQNVPIQAWMNHMFRDAHTFFFNWLQAGQYAKNKPIPWHVFTNPEGLFYALKESFSMQTDSGVDKVYLHARIQPNSKSESAEGKSTEEQVQSLGCYVQLGPVHLINGLYSQRTDTVELLPPFYVLQHGGSCQTNGHANSAQDSTLTLHVWASLESQGLNADQYLCPVHLRSMTMPRSLIQRDQHSLVAPVLRVPCNTTEDIQECEIQRMALFAAPSWLI